MGFLLVEGNLRGRGEIMSDTNTPGVGGSLLGPVERQVNLLVWRL